MDLKCSLHKATFWNFVTLSYFVSRLCYKTVQHSATCKMEALLNVCNQ